MSGPSTANPTASNAPVRVERRGCVGILTLNRPEERNAMSPALLDGFARAIDWALDEIPRDLRCVVITGTGTCFSAGANLRGALQGPGSEEGPGLLDHERSFAMYAPFLRTLEIGVPVIGALNGHAVGGGFGLSLLCDVRFANRDAKYGTNFARLGLHSGLGIGYLLPRIVGASRAAELLFTGKTVTGAEAEAMGLVSAAVAPDDVAPRALDLAEQIAAAAPLAVRSMKRSLQRFLAWDVRGAAWEEARAQAETLATEDAREGVAALLEKRTPRFRGR